MSLIFLLCISVSSAFAGTVVLGISPDNVSGKKIGDTFIVKVTATGAQDFYGAQINVNFDSSLLNVVDVNNNKGGVNVAVGSSFNPDNSFIAQNKADNRQGDVNFTATLLAPANPVNGSCDIAEITFEVIGSGTSNISITNKSLLSTSGAEPIAYTTIDCLFDNSQSQSQQEQQPSSQPQQPQQEQQTTPQPQQSQQNNSAEILIVLNGNKIQFPDVKPFILNDRTMVPVRFISENMGFNVEWNGALQEVKITNDNKIIKLLINKSKVLVDNKEVTLNVAPILYTDDLGRGRTMVPLRFISEVFGYQVNWNNELRQVTIQD